MVRGLPRQSRPRLLSFESAVNLHEEASVSLSGDVDAYPKSEIMKPVVWLGDSLTRVRDFPAEARHEAGVQLGLVQAGEEPSDWKPMPSVGLGVNEIRVRIGGAYRVMYVAKFAQAVYVLHAFQKKSRKIAQADIELARRRFRSLVQDRRQQWPKN